MSVDLQQRIRQAAEILRAAGATEVYVFGSTARGVERPDSDVDLAVRGLPPERYFFVLAPLVSALGRPVDLVDLDESTPFVRYLDRTKELRRVA
jgi:predicted nucleotidyltransferase